MKKLEELVKKLSKPWDGAKILDVPWHALTTEIADAAYKLGTLRPHDVRVPLPPEPFLQGLLPAAGAHGRRLVRRSLSLLVRRAHLQGRSPLLLLGLRVHQQPRQVGGGRVVIPWTNPYPPFLSDDDW